MGRFGASGSFLRFATVGGLIGGGTEYMTSGSYFMLIAVVVGKNYIRMHHGIDDVDHWLRAVEFKKSWSNSEKRIEQHWMSDGDISKKGYNYNKLDKTESSREFHVCMPPTVLNNRGAGGERVGTE